MLNTRDNRLACRIVLVLIIIPYLFSLSVFFLSNLDRIFLKVVLLNDFITGISNGVVEAMREIVTTLRAALGLGSTESIKVTSS